MSRNPSESEAIFNYQKLGDKVVTPGRNPSESEAIFNYYLLRLKERIRRNPSESEAIFNKKIN